MFVSYFEYFWTLGSFFLSSFSENTYILLNLPNQLKVSLQSIENPSIHIFQIVMFEENHSRLLLYILVQLV